MHRSLCLAAIYCLLGSSLPALTYVSGSLTDSNPTNGNGVSTPSGTTNLQYSDGNASGSYGQIDIADDPADPDWVYDLGSTKAISSLSFWSYGGTTSYSQMPAGTITIYGSSSSSGSWTQIGQVTRDLERDTTPPNSQATAGEGFRVPCNGSSYRYVRVNVVTPFSTGGLDNRWIIRRVEENSPIVIHDFHRTSDGSSALNDLPRIPYNAIDGTTSTIWNPQATAMKMTLDLGPTARRFQRITMTPDTNEGSYLPQQGEVLVSSTDDPDNMDTVVGIFDIAWTNEDTDPAVIVLAQPFQKRYVQIAWSSIRYMPRGQTRFGEIQVDTVAAPSTGTDITQSGIPSTYRVTPNDGIDDTTKLQAALDHYKSVYLPQGTYNISNHLYMPDDSRLHGYSDDTTILALNTTNTAAIRMEGGDNVILDHFRINRTVGDATESAIFIYRSSGGDSPGRITLDAVKVTNNRSRAQAILALYADVISVTNCSVYESQDQILDTDSNYYIYGSGITLGSCTNVHISGNNISESRDLFSALPSPHGAGFYQAGGLEVVGCRFAIVRDNVVERFGNGIDIGRTSQSLVQANWIEDIHQTGIKLVNGTNRCTVRGNHVEKCGITAMWLGCGAAPTYAQVHHNLIDDNDIVGTGLGIAEDFWTGAFGWAPAGISVDVAPTTALRCEYNTVINNDFHENSAMSSPASTYAVYISTLSVAPYMTTTSNNTIH